MRRALHAALLVVLLATAGCAGLLGPDRPPSDERAVEAVDRSRDAFATVDAYRFSYDATVDASKGDEDVSVDVDGSGVVDVAGREMAATSRVDGEERRTYVSGPTVYSECARMGWGEETISADSPWLEQTPAGRQLALLNGTDVYWRGSETLDGRETTVVAAYPTKEEFVSQGEARGTDVTDLGGVNVKNITVRAWLDAETHLPVQTRTRVEMKKGGATATLRMTTRFRDYGGPVNVTRPGALDDDVTWEHGCPTE